MVGHVRREVGQGVVGPLVVEDHLHDGPGCQDFLQGS